jgi:hypothetical protein
LHTPQGIKLVLITYIWYIDKIIYKLYVTCYYRYATNYSPSPIQQAPVQQAHTISNTTYEDGNEDEEESEMDSPYDS